MKTVKINTEVKNHEPLILLNYWFISNKHNQKVFECLNQLQLGLGNDALKIVCLNPFNSQEDINQYKSDHNLAFEMVADVKHSGLFYQVNAYPTLILMKKTGKILLRQSGYKEELLEDFELMIKKGQTEHSQESENSSSIFSLKSYKNNLSFYYKKV